MNDDYVDPDERSIPFRSCRTTHVPYHALRVITLKDSAGKWANLYVCADDVIHAVWEEEGFDRVEITELIADTGYPVALFADYMVVDPDKM